jgi:hypothetical protein
LDPTQALIKTFGVDPRRKSGLIMLSQLTIAGLDDERIAQFRSRGFYTAYNRTSAGITWSGTTRTKHKSFPPDIDWDPAKSYAFRV